MYARKIAQIADTRRHMRRGCGTMTYRRNRKRSRKAPVVREVQISRHRQLFLVFLFAVSQFFFLQSSMFVVRDIEVKGQAKIPEAKIRGAIGLDEGARYWELSPERIESDILEINGLHTASVNVSFPGRVTVNVAERKPLFTVASLARTKQHFTVDKEGVILGRGDAAKGSLMVVLDRTLKTGGRLSPDELEVCTYLGTHLRPDIANRLEHVRFDDRGEVILRVAYGAGKIPIRLGRAERLSYKLFLLEELLASLKAEKAQVVSVDLRYSTPIVRQPYTKPPVPEAPPAE